MIKTYVTDITHFLDSNGELAKMPKAARMMASSSFCRSTRLLVARRVRTRGSSKGYSQQLDPR
jgi:hypothetical protein